MKAHLTEGPIARSLLRLIAPMIIGTFSLVAFNLVDTYFVSGLGTAALTAISYTFPIVMTIGSIAMGLGVGMSSLISRLLGQDSQHEVKQTAAYGILLTLCIVLVLFIAGLFSIDRLFRLLGAQPNVLTLARDYMHVWYLGMFFFVISIVCNNIIRSTGNTLFPSLVMFISALLNVGLDPLLIYGWGPIPALGMKGAALATITARFISMSMGLRWIARKFDIMSIAIPSWSALIASWQKIIVISIPVALTTIIVPLSTGVIMRMLSSFGPQAVAAFGIVMRIEAVVFIVLIALSSAISPFVGQNWGAKNYQRMYRAMNISYGVSLFWGLFIAVIFAVMAVPIVGAFTRDTNIIRIACKYLYIVPISYGAYGMAIMVSAAFNASGRPLYACVASLLRMFVFYIPLALLARMWFGYVGIFYASSIANVLAAIVAVWWFRSSHIAVQRAAAIKPELDPYQESFLVSTSE